MAETHHKPSEAHHKGEAHQKTEAKMADTSDAPTAERGMAAVAYILTWVTGLIVLLTAKKEEKYKRWHAVQAIGIGIVLTVIYVVMNVVLVGMVASVSSYAMWSMVALIVNLASLAVIILMAITAYQGKKIRIPFLADLADKNA